MAKKIISGYQLCSAEDRASIISASSLNPTASIPADRLARVEKQRQRFIKNHGNDGLNYRTFIKTA